MNPTLIHVLENSARHLKSPLHLVGGPIRDELLGRPCDDWDMVCRGAQSIARQSAKDLRAKFIVLDEQHKIYRVILPEAFRPIHTLDFAEMQGRTIEADLKRRDFTINAMARPLMSFRRRPESRGLDWTPASTGVTAIIDPFGGQRDLKRKIIRAVSEKVFVEDPLRLVRAFRFAAQFQFAIEARTLRWIQTHRAALSRVAAERVREELLRLWKQPHSSDALRQMDRVKLLSGIFPEIEACRRTALRYYGKGGVLKHSLETVENLEWILSGFEEGKEGRREAAKTPFFSSSLLPFVPKFRDYLNLLIGGYPRSAWLKWGAFLHDIGKPATAKMHKGRLRFFEHEHVGAGLAIRIAQRLRCSRQEVHLLGQWVRHHMRTGSLAAAPQMTDKAISRFFRDLGEEGIGMVLVSLADHFTYLRKSLWGKGTDPVEKMAARLLRSYLEKRAKILPAKVVDGHQLMRALKLKPGPVIGKLLEAIQDAQAEGKVTTKEEALVFAKRAIRRRLTRTAVNP